MKNKILESPKINKILEKSVFIILVILLFLILNVFSNLDSIRFNDRMLNSSEQKLESINKQLENINSDNNTVKDPNLISYDLWLSGCASTVNKYIYNNTGGLKLLGEKSQKELDDISKNFKLTIDNMDYGRVVKFIIIDKKQNTFITNDVNNIDFIKNNIPSFLKEDGSFFNYVSEKGKWFIIARKIEDTPYYKTNNLKIDIEIIDPNNFVEVYWFPKDYKYSKEDEPLINFIFKDSKSHFDYKIKDINTDITMYKDRISKRKIVLIIDFSIIIVFIVYLYFIGLKGIMDAFRNSIITKSIKFLTDFIEGSSTLFKSTFFIFSSAFTVCLTLYSLETYKDFNSRYILYFIYMGLYYFYILPRFIRFTKYLDKIIKGSSNITDGNLEHIIPEKGDKSLLKLAKNINVINKGFKVSIEDQIRNERLKSELVTNVSHDLKTPLTSIINYTDILLREDISDEEREKFLQVLNSKSLRLKKLIEDLFEISKINSGKIELNKSPVDVMELLDQSIAEYSDTEIYFDKNLEFIVKFFAPSVEMNLDGNKMSRVFENLINNALKYSMKDTRVYVEVIEIEKGIKISFKNVSSEPLNFDKKEIFERFSRGDKSRNSDIDGSGLGLAIAKSIVELHEGIMYVDFEADLFKATIELYYTD